LGRSINYKVLASVHSVHTGVEVKFDKSRLQSDFNRLQSTNQSNLYRTKIPKFTRL